MEVKVIQQTQKDLQEKEKILLSGKRIETNLEAYENKTRSEIEKSWLIK